MNSFDKKLDSEDKLVSKIRRREMEHLQWIEGNPLDEEQKAMFEMFDREDWSHEKRRQYLLDRVEATKRKHLDQ